MLVGMHTMRSQRIKLGLLALEGARQCFTEFVHAGRIAPSGVREQRMGDSSVTPKDIFPVDELLALGLGEKIKIFLF